MQARYRRGSGLMRVTIGMGRRGSTGYIEVRDDAYTTKGNGKASNNCYLLMYGSERAVSLMRMKTIAHQ